MTRENLRIGASLALGSFMVLLDSTVVSVATPTLAARFGASLSAVAWATTAYLLTLSLVIPLSAWAMERFGGKRVWLGAVAVFCLGSLLCGTAWSISALIVMRVVQGLGGGLLPPVGQALIGRTVGPRQMARVMAVLSVPMLLGPVLGPVIAGLLIDDAGWRWIFLINLPLGVLAFALVRRVVPAQPAQPGHRLDLRGVLMVSPGLAALVYGCAEVGAAGGFSSVGGDAALVGGIVLLIAFGWYGLRPQLATSAARPGLLLDLRLLTSRGTGAAMAGAFLLGAGMYGALFLLPLFFEQAKGADALHAGLLLGPQGIGAAVTSLLAGRLVSRTGGRVLVAVGMAVCALGTVPFVLLTAGTSTSWLAAVLLVRGFGMGLVMAPLFTAAYAGLDRSAIPRASTLFNILNRLGGSLGTAAMAIALQRRLSAPSSGTGTNAAAHLASAYNAAFVWALVISVVALGAALLLPGRPPRSSL